MENKPRIEWIDSAKFFCIVLIVMGHIGMPEPLTQFFSSFRVPLFFFVSGFLYHYDALSPRGFLKRKIRTLLMPYLLFSMITYLIWLIFTAAGGAVGDGAVSPWIPLLGIFYSVGEGHFLIHNAPLWFITCLFTVEALYFFAVAPLNGKSRWIAIFLMSVLGYLCTSVLPFRLPWSADVALSGVVFYGLGRFAKSLERPKIISSKSYALLCLVFCLVCSQINGRVDMNHLRYGNYLLFYMAAISGIGVAIYAAQTLPVNRFYKFFGRHTAPIMAFHLGAINFIHFLRFESVTSIYVSGGVPLVVCVVDTILIFFMLTPVIVWWDRGLRWFLKRFDEWVEGASVVFSQVETSGATVVEYRPFWN